MSDRTNLDTPGPRRAAPALGDPLHDGAPHSHGIGIRAHVPAVARAAVAAGADALIIEVHPRPEKALSDGHQSLTPASSTS